MNRLHDRLGTAVLAERNFRLFFMGYSVSLAGSAMAPVALTFAILAQGGGPRQVGIVLAAETAALVVLLLVGGVVADRVSRKTVMVAADLLRCLGQCGLALVLWNGHAPLPLLVGLALVLGSGQAFFGPALTGLVPAIVTPDRLQPANALLGVARSLAQIVGPALAGLLVAGGGAAAAIAADAASYGFGAICLARLHGVAFVPRGTEPFFTQLRLGWSEFIGHRWLWIIVVQFGFYHMLVLAPQMVLGAVVAETRLGGASAWGLILSVQGAGAVLGGLAAMGTRPGRPLVVAGLGVLAGTPLLLTLAWPAPLWLILVAASLSGAGFAIFTLMFDTTLQREIPPESLSRVSSYDWLGSFALIPVGYVLVGPLSELFGTSGTLWLAGAWLGFSSLAVLAVPAVHGLLDRRQPADREAAAVGET